MRDQIIPINLIGFVRESNRIEGIYREPIEEEITAHARFLRSSATVMDLIEFVAAVQPDAVLRNRAGLDVVVGRYYPPPGGPDIERHLTELLLDLSHPYFSHQAYEALHPFTDGNGRSGRVLWLWTMGGLERAPLGFLHHWYYQSLQDYCAVSTARDALNFDLPVTRKRD